MLGQDHCKWYWQCYIGYMLYIGYMTYMLAVKLNLKDIFNCVQFFSFFFFSFFSFWKISCLWQSYEWIVDNIDITCHNLYKQISNILLLTFHIEIIYLKRTLFCHMLGLYSIENSTLLWMLSDIWIPSLWQFFLHFDVIISFFGVSQELY